ncbi:hypothetical protein Cantr_02667 [Candida viswanathii]|uniref:NADH dehydrogenase [ubiquinone] 1 alpha subcomplex assembly factor 3 n=1 Tax=Candida viswanathii TaxID=5486 RepID=A0A367YN37_9ASCO|nr:hypothetical protein Cantr_02667 [Candida viswanathii]
MGLFDLLSFSSPASPTIPTYNQNEDSINLQIKSLLYLFKRLKINKLAPFPSISGTLKHIDSTDDAEGNPTYDKLDKIYDLEKFLEVLLAHDEYRVLVDFIKNKFRAMCMVSEYPVSSSRPSSPAKGQSATQPLVFPDFVDYKERSMNGKNFRFVLFPLEGISVDKIAQVLTSSDIYVEHNVSYSKRYSIAVESIRQVISSKQTSITIDQKNQIIRNYLTKMAFFVQLSRIYQEYTKLHPLVIGSPVTPSASPTKKTITLRKSMSNLTLNKQQQAPPSSPTKLAHKKSMGRLSTKPSIPKFKLDELYNPVTSPRKSKPTESDTSSGGDDGVGGSTELDQENVRIDVYEKCKVAIIDKLNQEKSKLIYLFGSSGRPSSASSHGRPSPEQILRPPQNKSQAPANPADILKKNDILMYANKPVNYIESVRDDGYYLANNFLVTSPDATTKDQPVGLLLLHSETFEVAMGKDAVSVDNDWLVTFDKAVLGVFELIHPKPEILVVGLGKKSRMLSLENRQTLTNLGIQLEISDLNNAAQIFDLLATERPNVIGALLLPPNM